MEDDPTVAGLREEVARLRRRNAELESLLANGRKGTLQEMIRMERQSALEELAAGISHNLNNILTGVLGPAQLIQRGSQDPDVLSEVEDILASTQRARQLLRRLNRAVRGEPSEAPGPILLNEVVRETVEAARPRWRRARAAKGVEIQVATELDGALSPVRGTRAGLRDVLTNLLLNAVEAMPEGGTVALRTWADGAGAGLAVRDSGVGMEEETSRRMFEPFFTTKAEVGSGLGLCTVYRAVVGWGGRIDVESAPGAGTTVSVWLPGWEETARDAAGA